MNKNLLDFIKVRKFVRTKLFPLAYRYYLSLKCLCEFEERLAGVIKAIENTVYIRLLYYLNKGDTRVFPLCSPARLSMECELRNFTTRYELIKYLARILQWQGEDGDGDSIKFGYKSIVVFPKHTKYFQSNEVKKCNNSSSFTLFLFISLDIS